jgi:hypothetical protein
MNQDQDMSSLVSGEDAYRDRKKPSSLPSPINPIKIKELLRPAAAFCCTPRSILVAIPYLDAIKRNKLFGDFTV